MRSGIFVGATTINCAGGGVCGCGAAGEGGGGGGGGSGIAERKYARTSRGVCSGKTTVQRVLATTAAITIKCSAIESGNVSYIRRLLRV